MDLARPVWADDAHFNLSIQHREPDSPWAAMHFEVAAVGDRYAKIVGRDANGDEVVPPVRRLPDGTWKWVGSTLAPGPDGRHSWTLGDQWRCGLDQ